MREQRLQGILFSTPGRNPLCNDTFNHRSSTCIRTLHLRISYKILPGLSPNLVARVGYAEYLSKSPPIRSSQKCLIDDAGAGKRLNRAIYLRGDGELAVLEVLVWSSSREAWLFGFSRGLDGERHPTEVGEARRVRVGLTEVMADLWGDWWSGARAHGMVS